MRAVALIFLTFSLLITTCCEVIDYPYFIKKNTPCISSKYDEKVALVISFYTEGDYGFPTAKELLEDIGYEVLLYDELDELTVESLDEKKISVVWVFSSCDTGSITSEEENELFEFTENGGSLVVLADNHPCIVGVTGLAEKFDVEFAVSNTGTVPLLKKSDDTLKEHCITKDLDELPGGVTPSTIVYPEDDDDYTVIGETEVDTLFVVLENEKKRVFFDSAWTRYTKNDWETNKDSEEMLKKLIQNIADYLDCKCS
jgi:hypothetical protein